MHNFGIAFEILDCDPHVALWWKKVTGHMDFEVNMYFTMRAHWVLNRHSILDPEVSLYAGVVSRDSISIALTYNALNIFNVVVVDIRNTYIQAPSSQKDHIICGPEFGL